MSTRVHLDATPKGATIHRTACGDLNNRGVRDVKSVTCKRCLKQLAKAQQEFLKERASADTSLPMPAFGCTQHTPCGTCGVCKMEAEAARYEHYAPWQQPSRIAPREKRFSSVTHALETYVRIREEGYGYGVSPSSFETLRDYGCKIAFAPSRESRAIAAADDIALLERLLVETFEDFAYRRCLTISTCIDVLVARVVGRVEVVTSRWGRQHRKRIPVPSVELAREFRIPVGEVGIIVRSGRLELAKLLIGYELMEAA